MPPARCLLCVLDGTIPATKIFRPARILRNKGSSVAPASSCTLKSTMTTQLSLIRVHAHQNTRKYFAGLFLRVPSEACQEIRRVESRTDFERRRFVIFAPFSVYRRRRCSDKAAPNMLQKVKPRSTRPILYVSSQMRMLRALKKAGLDFSKVRALQRVEGKDSILWMAAPWALSLLASQQTQR